MKISLLLSFGLLFSFGLFSQNIITYSQSNSQVGFLIQGTLWGYKTHFVLADSSKLTFISSVDTVEFWVYSSQNEEMISFNTNNQFPSAGSYDLYLENSIDGVLFLPKAVSVSYPKYMQGIDVTSNWRFGVDTTVNLHIWSYSLDFYPDTAYNAYFFRPNQDTIFIDSVEVKGTRDLTLFFSIDSNSAAGFYDLYVYKSPDSLIGRNNAIFISNSNVVQIDSVSPDSMNNLGILPTKIQIYGNHTHFTLDSNKLFPIREVDFDSVIVINDSVLKAYITFPMLLKQAVFPNAIVALYNPTDGLLEYPIRLVIYSAIDNQMLEYDNVKLFPNPAQDNIWIESSEFSNEEQRVSIINVNGQKVAEYVFSNQRLIQLKINDLAAGIYFVYIQGSKKQKVIKFIKN